MRCTSFQDFTSYFLITAQLFLVEVMYYTLYLSFCDWDDFYAMGIARKL